MNKKVVSVEWNPGPANGGGGTADDPNQEKHEHGHYWLDGQLLLVMVGEEVSTVRVHAGDFGVEFANAATGDFDFGWTDQNIDWWAILDDVLPNKVTLIFTLNYTYET